MNGGGKTVLEYGTDDPVKPASLVAIGAVVLAVISGPAGAFIAILAGENVMNLESISWMLYPGLILAPDGIAACLGASVIVAAVLRRRWNDGVWFALAALGICVAWPVVGYLVLLQIGPRAP